MESDHKCPDCGFLVFRQLSSLREHEHCEAPWICGICDKEDMTASELIEHYRDEHEDTVAWYSDSDSEIELLDQ